MLVIVSYILNKLAPIVNFIGVLGIIGSICVCSDCGKWTVDSSGDMCSCITAGVHWTLYSMTIVFAVIGLIFGIFAYKNDIPPRWTWSRSRNSLFEFSIAAVLGYAVNFAMWPPCVFFVRFIIEKI